MTAGPETPTAWSEELGRKPRRGDLLDVDVERIDHRGKGVGRVGPYRVSVGHGLPGARLRVNVSRRRSESIEARVEEVLEPSPLAVEARCTQFGTCGGCSLQDLGYADQLVEKRRLAQRLLASVPLPDGVEIEAPVACESPWAYRNKMDFTFSSRRWVEEHEPENAEADFALGLHVAGWHGKVLDVRDCLIQSPECGAVLASAREIARAQELAPWDLTEHKGLLRHLVLRKSATCADLLVYLVTSDETPELVQPYADALIAARPEITTLVHGVNSRIASVAVGERDTVLYGPGYLRERLGGVEFRVSATSFFQTNTAQAEKLVEIVREAAAVGPKDVVYDLYCGGGSLGLALARDAREVWGFEVVDSAIDDARQNAAANGVRNAFFVGGDVLQSLHPRHPGATRRPFPDVLVVDPPRAGLHPRVLEVVAGLRPQRLVYVSCNPRAAATDVAGLVEQGMRVQRVQPIDLFPHTPHLEIVFTLVPARAGS